MEQYVEKIPNNIKGRLSGKEKSNRKRTAVTVMNNTNLMWEIYGSNTKGKN